MKAYFDPRQDLHIPRSYLSRGQMRTPLEIPERTAHILKALEGLGVEVREPSDHGRSPLALVHDAGYLDFLEHAYQRWHEVPEDWGDEVMSNVYRPSYGKPRGILAEAACYLADGSCPVGEHTWTSAYWSAQAALSAADDLLVGERLAYGVCRPPGHHARRDAAGGFCYLNNAAIAAETLKQKFPRLAILDPDMHHGQGIQEIFYHRNDVLYVSIHGDPTNFYPVVTGHTDERGTGAGEGYNVNLPMPHGSPESVFFDRLGEAVGIIGDYRPDAVILTLGFDIHEKDAQAKVAVTTAGFRRIGEAAAALDLPLLVIQEGGYYLEGLEPNTREFFGGLGLAS